MLAPFPKTSFLEINQRIWRQEDFWPEGTNIDCSSQARRISENSKKLKEQILIKLKNEFCSFSDSRVPNSLKTQKRGF